MPILAFFIQINTSTKDCLDNGKAYCTAWVYQCSKIFFFFLEYTSHLKIHQICYWWIPYHWGEHQVFWWLSRDKLCAACTSWTQSLQPIRVRPDSLKWHHHLHSIWQFIGLLSAQFQMYGLELDTYILSPQVKHTVITNTANCGSMKNGTEYISVWILPLETLWLTEC